MEKRGRGREEGEGEGTKRQGITLSSDDAFLKKSSLWLLCENRLENCS